MIGCHVGGATQLVSQVASAMLPVHYATYNIALMDGVITKDALYVQIEAVVKSGHLYFA